MFYIVVYNDSIFAYSRSSTNPYFALQFDGGLFKLFSPTHWAALLVIIGFNLFFIVRARQFSPEARIKIRHAMAAVLILNEVVWHIWNWTVGRYIAIVELLARAFVCLFIYPSSFSICAKRQKIITRPL